MFDKVYLIKSISAATNYNSSSCLFKSDKKSVKKSEVLFYPSHSYYRFQPLMHYTGCSIKKITKYWDVKPIKNVILRLSKSLKLPKIWDILKTSQVFSKGGLKFPFKASKSQIPKYLIFHNTGYKIFA